MSDAIVARVMDLVEKVTTLANDVRNIVGALQAIQQRLEALEKTNTDSTESRH